MSSDAKKAYLLKVLSTPWQQSTDVCSETQLVDSSIVMRISQQLPPSCRKAMKFWKTKGCVVMRHWVCVVMCLN